MTGDVMLYLAMLLLPLSALVARRLPIGQVFKMVLAWFAIFALLFLVVVAWQSAMGFGTSGTRAVGHLT